MTNQHDTSTEGSTLARLEYLEAVLDTFLVCLYEDGEYEIADSLSRAFSEPSKLPD